MTHSNLRVEVHDPYILVAMRGTCLTARYRKQDAPWLAPRRVRRRSGSQRSLPASSERPAWEVANEAARQLGWIRSCNELHEAVQLAASAQATLYGRLTNPNLGADAANHRQLKVARLQSGQKRLRTGAHS